MQAGSACCYAVSSTSAIRPRLCSDYNYENAKVVGSHSMERIVVRYQLSSLSHLRQDALLLLLPLDSKQLEEEQRSDYVRQPCKYLRI